MFEQKLLTHLAEGELQKRGRKGFREIACRNHHETNREWNSLSKRFSCRYTNGRLHSLPLQRLSFVGQGSSLEALPPCLETSEPLCTGADTHTHTLRILCTELNAVPHAGLGFQFLRVQVRKPKRKRRSIQRRSQGFRWPATPKENSQVHRRCSSPLLKETTK